MTGETLPKRFPKVASPYHRSEDDDGNYTIDPFSVKQKFSWAFDRAEDVEAIEKLDGTNCAVEISEHEHGGYYVSDVATRMGDKSMNIVEPYGPRTNHHYISRAVQNSIRRGYTEWLADEYGTGWFFGEVVGPKFQGNPHELDEGLFVPFDWARDKLEYRSYGKYSTEYDAIRDWFAGEENGLFSLFASRMHGQDLEASRPMNGTFVEGLILIHPNFDGRIHPDDLTLGNTGPGDRGKVKELVKIRRDMFSEHSTDEWPMTEYGHN